ncbi:MAG: ferritin-like domain-containing protein [Thermoanaerobaculia bacterium]|nr:ferritin-like domain-containing protein [Thermoanaerobaculia bacterium]
MSQIPDAKTFVARLVNDIHGLFSQLGERETLESESDGNVEVVTLLKLALTSELEAAEIAAYWLPTTPEIDAKTVLSEQCADELRHYNLIKARLEELGEDMAGFDALAEGHSPLYQYLRGLRTTPERIAAGPFATEAVAEVRNAQFIAFCHSVGDTETAALYEETIHPEESHHHARGREILEKYATTPEIQQTVTTAVHSSLAIADELRDLMEKSTGLANIPLS